MQNWYASQSCAYLKNRLFSVSIEWHSRLLLLTSVVFTTLVQWIGALQKNTPNPLGRAWSRQEVRCKGTAKESPGMIAGSTTGSATEISVSAFNDGLPPKSLPISEWRTGSEPTVWGWRAVQSQFHRCLKSVLHNEGGSDSDYFPSTAFHSYRKDHTDRWEWRELGRSTEVKRVLLSFKANT